MVQLRRTLVDITLHITFQEKTCERSQNTVLLASTQAVYKAPHSTVRETVSQLGTVSHRTDARAAVAVAVGSLRA